MTFTVNKADWVNEWSIQYTVIRNNTPDILNKLRSIKRITDYTGGEKYIFRDYDNNQGTMNDVNLNERNRQFQWQAFDRGGRQFSRIRVNYPVLVDTEQEVKNTLSSPKEDILRTIQNKFLKRRNKAISDAVIADTQIVQADGTVSAVSASNDGVITTDLTSGTFNKNTFINIRDNFVANEVVDASLYDLGGDVIVSQVEMRVNGYDDSFGIFFAVDFILGKTKGNRVQVIQTAL